MKVNSTALVRRCTGGRRLHLWLLSEIDMWRESSSDSYSSHSFLIGYIVWLLVVDVDRSFRAGEKCGAWPGEAIGRLL